MNEIVAEAVGEVESPRQRAQRRAARLRSAFTDVLETLADIYRDEDWRELADEEGNPYRGFTAFVADQLGWKGAYARRHQQAIRSLILPLRELTMHGARIPVTSADVARLGQRGAEEVVRQAPCVLAGIDHHDGQTAALRRLIDAVAGPRSHAGVIEDQPQIGELVPAAIPASGPTSAGLPAAVAVRADLSGPPGNRAHEAAADTAEYVEVHRGEQESSSCCTALEDAIAAVLRVDPVGVAQTVDVTDHPSLASDAVNAAHRLSRFAHLLQALAPSPGGQR